MEKNSKIIPVVIGLIQKEGKFLISERLPSNEFSGGYWEFPGGKINQNETVYQALYREMQEELNIQVVSARPWFEFKHSYLDRSVLLNTWIIDSMSNEPIGAEGQRIQWVIPSEFKDFKFLAGSQVIINQLTMPDFQITG